MRQNTKKYLPNDLVSNPLPGPLPTERKMPPSEPTLTVIVPCYNSERTILECLNSIISKQTSVELDVIVVDSSSDQTGPIVEHELRSVRQIKLKEVAFAVSAGTP